MNEKLQHETKLIDRSYLTNWSNAIQLFFQKRRILTVLQGLGFKKGSYGDILGEHYYNNGVGTIVSVMPRSSSDFPKS